MDWTSLSNRQIHQEMGKRVKAIRLQKRLTQQEVAEKAGVSLYSITQIENGKSVSLSTFIPVLRVLRLLNNLEQLLPEQEVSPVEVMRLKGKSPQRIKPSQKAR